MTRIFGGVVVLFRDAPAELVFWPNPVEAIAEKQQSIASIIAHLGDWGIEPRNINEPFNC